MSGDNDLRERVNKNTFETIICTICDFQDWVYCECAHCRSQSDSHAVNTYGSMSVLAEQVERLLPLDKELEGKL